MANNPQNYLIAGNDEHGINPPTLGKRTPIMPYVGRSFYENEFNYAAKNVFLSDCLRIGFNILDVKPNRQDLSVSSRVVIVNRARPSALITFAYNAFGDGTTFNNANGVEAYFSPLNNFAERSRTLAELVYGEILEATSLRGRGVQPLDVGLLSNVNTIACLVECGFMTNFREAKLMLNPDFVDAVGRASCRGVCKLFNVTYTPIENFVFPTLRVGSNGNLVKYLQFNLKIAGYDVGAVDGVFGNQTRNAVVAFQQANNLTPDGIVGRATWFRLNNLNPQASVLRRGSVGTAVKYLQQKLFSFLYPVGAIDGIFGADTERAVREFQAEHNLTVDGIVGPATWRALDDEANSRSLPN